MINFVKDPAADSRVINGKVDPEKLKLATYYHRKHVRFGMFYLSDMIVSAGENHDNTKLKYFDDFHKAVESGNTRKSKWYKMHIKSERHHLNKPPEDINLVDVMEHIVDCVMAGTARGENIYEIHLSDELLQKAYRNTIEMVKSQLVIEEVQTDDNSSTRISGRG